MDERHCRATCMPVCTKLCVKGTGGHGITHTIEGLIGFVCIFAFFYLFVDRWRIFYGPALCASGCIIAVFIGREFSDRQKLGYWDWEGLLAPSITVSVLAIIISTGVHASKHDRCWLAHKHRGVLSMSEDHATDNDHVPLEITHKHADTRIYHFHEHEDASMEKRPIVLVARLPYLRL